MSVFNQLPHASVWFMTAAVSLMTLCYCEARCMNFVGTAVGLGSLGWLEFYRLHVLVLSPSPCFLGGEAGNSLARSMVSALRVAADRPHPWDPCMQSQHCLGLRAFYFISWLQKSSAGSTRRTGFTLIWWKVSSAEILGPPFTSKLS